MDTTSELQNWLSEHARLTTAEARQALYQKITATLATKDETAHLAMLKAIKASVANLRAEVEQKLSPSPVADCLRVFPASQAEKEFLETLFSRMKISFSKD